MQNPQKVSRRGFLGRITMSWAAFTSLPFIYGIIRYIYPPPGGEVFSEKSIVAAQTQDIGVNSSKIVRFNKRPVIVIHAPEGEFRAFSAKCTHLGCLVEYKGEKREFHCNCHGSIFDINGKNIKGPASSPLPRLNVSVEEANVIVTYLPV